MDVKYNKLSTYTIKSFSIGVTSFTPIDVDDATESLKIEDAVYGEKALTEDWSVLKALESIGYVVMKVGVKDDTD